MILHPHNPAWKAEFRRLESFYCAVLGERVLGVEHVGSTAIKQIVAKPILDIDIVILAESHFAEVREKLQSLGYIYNGDQGIPGREAFQRKDDGVPHCEKPEIWMNHHLYVCVDGSRELERHVRFRDYLNEHREARQEYEAIKKGIEARSGGDHKRYAHIKESEELCTVFVESVLKKSQNVIP